MGFVKEFRDFAMRGNVVDMAVGIVIGAAFGGIVNSLIKDVVMPIVGLAGNVDFSNQYIPLSDKVKEAAAAAPGGTLTLEQARGAGPVLAYGNFVTVVINFIILAFAIFLVIKAMNTAKKRFEREAVAAAPPPAPPDVVLLAEIRDILKRG